MKFTLAFLYSSAASATFNLFLCQLRKKKKKMELVFVRERELIMSEHDAYHFKLS